MGCDIHLYVEKKDPQGRWNSAEQFVTEEEDGEVITRRLGDRFYSGRNYSLFAILADVRNGRGFAGCDIGDGFIPISQPKGLPNDVSTDIKAESDRWGPDGHSHSYLTLAEIASYDWTQGTKSRGYVSFSDFVDFKRFGSVGSSCGNVWGSTIEKIDQARAEGIYEEAMKQSETSWGEPFKAKINELLEAAYPGKNVQVQIEWPVKYAAEARDFWWETMPRLLKLAEGDFESVRLVFWFDN